MKHLFSFVMLLCLAMSINVANAKTYVMITNDAETLDDDEQAAKDWFLSLSETKEGNFLCYTANQVAESQIDLTGIDCVWVNFDKEGAGNADEFWTNYSGSLSDATFLAKLGDYWKTGGNILFTNHANLLVNKLGRYNVLPGNFGCGAGGDNHDAWSVCVEYGTWSTDATRFDHSGDQLFNGIEIVTGNRNEQNTYKKIMVLSGDYKEDHNCWWWFDLPAPEYKNDNGNPEKMTKLKELYGVTLLATREDIQDYCGATICYWDAFGDFKGHAYSIGMGGYEWNVNKGTNAYRGNIEKLTLNALAILAYDKNLSTGVEAIDTDNSAVVATEYYNLQGARIANPENGIYIVKRVMESGKVATSKEIIK